MSEIINKYLEIAAFAMWGSGGSGFDTLLRPVTKQGNAFRKIVDENPDKFHSCMYFSDGSMMTNCKLP
jgi:hypothetical protein